jgi:hypothetical protein
MQDAAAVIQQWIPGKSDLVDHLVRHLPVGAQLIVRPGHLGQPDIVNPVSGFGIPERVMRRRY